MPLSEHTDCGNVGYRSSVRAARCSREVNITRIMSDRYGDNGHDLKQIKSGTDRKGRMWEQTKRMHRVKDGKTASFRRKDLPNPYIT